MEYPTHFVDAIQVVPDVLPQSTCDAFISRFHQEDARQKRQLVPDHLSFTQLTINHVWPELVPSLALMFRQLAQHYAQTMQLQHVWPAGEALEAFRIKRYLPTGADYFREHLDVQDYASAKRFLVMFAYLNTVEDGGETTFPRWGVSIKPKVGSVLLFPPGPPYVHAGEAPISGPKFILSTYCHYV